MSAFVGERKRFEQPVTLELVPGVQALGFVTRDALAAPGLEGRVAVYLPQAFNVAGQLLLVDRARVRPLVADSAAVMTLVVSGGAAGSL
jgi:uncharacterized membrane protein